jgi:hypothetical protein
MREATIVFSTGGPVPSTPVQILLSLDFEDRFLSRVRKLAETDVRAACETFFRNLRESLLPRLQSATGEEVYALVEELRTTADTCRCQGEACQCALVEDVIQVLQPFAVAPSTPIPTPVLVEESEPDAGWAALQREFGEGIDAAGILQKLRATQDEIAAMQTEVEELGTLKEALRLTFGTADPAAIGSPCAVSETELRAQLQSVRQELSVARIKLRDLESAFDESDPAKIRLWLRHLRDELYSKERVQERILSECRILAEEFQTMDAAAIVAQNRLLRERLTEALELNHELKKELSREETMDLESLLSDVESALGALSIK